MRHCCFILFVIIQLGASAALADIDYFGRGPTSPTDDAFFELMDGPDAPLRARLQNPVEVELQGTGAYGIDSTALGTSLDAMVTFTYKSVKAWAPTLLFTIRGTDLLEDSRDSNGDFGLRVGPDLCSKKKDKEFAFTCFAQVKATGLGGEVGGSADLGAKYRLIALGLDFSLQAGPRVGSLGWGYGTRLAVGYGYLVRPEMLLSLRASMTAGAKTFVAPASKAGAELVFQPSTKLKFGLMVQQPVFVHERPMEVGSWLAYTL